ncbi:MAG: esterase-like activity of phytase family protein [Alphaproteobacteria bacterium]
MRLAWLGLALALGPAAVAAEPPPLGWDKAMAAASPVAVTAEAVAITGGGLNGLAFSGAWVLRGDHRNFGGFSGLLVAGDRLYAVSDKGWWFGASLIEGDGALRLADARLAPMRDGGGGRYTKAGGDAEGLTRLGARLPPRLVVSFERDHRLMFLRETGRMGAAIQPRAFEQFRSNKGLEALASLPDGRLLAFAEGVDEGGVPMFVADPAGGVTEARLPRAGSHAVTGADIGPDGRLYLVLREYSILFGVSIRVMRYRLGADGLPLAASAETLATFEAASGIDNMEGISLERGPDGGIRLWLISDNNFRSSQRTLLVRFEVLP